MIANRESTSTRLWFVDRRSVRKATLRWNRAPQASDVAGIGIQPWAQPSSRLTITSWVCRFKARVAQPGTGALLGLCDSGQMESQKRILKFSLDTCRSWSLPHSQKKPRRYARVASSTNFRLCSWNKKRSLPYQYRTAESRAYRMLSCQGSTPQSHTKHWDLATICGVLRRPCTT